MRIPAAAVRHAEQPVLVDPGGAQESGGLTIVPIVERGRVAGFEVRCRCGCRAFVECVSDEEESSP